MTAKEMLKILKADGWEIKNYGGSHVQLIHKIKRGKVTVPIHGGDIKKNTLAAILKQAGIHKP
jgi:predicted RNA binding protein YcfA (HicA-like mRNA interferase family)